MATATNMRTIRAGDRAQWRAWLRANCESAGEVWLVDIGIPREAYAMVGAAMPAHLFSMHDRVQLAAVRL